MMVLALVAPTACSGGWRRVEVTPRAFPARTQVQVWQDGSVTLLHGVTIGADTLAGVPFTKPPTCDSCRVHLALGRVDSLRTGSKERGFFRTAGLVLAISAVGAYLFRGVGGD